MARRDAFGTPGRSVFVFARFRLDSVQHQLWRGDELVGLKPKAFAVLSYLLEQRGRLVDKEELLERFWGGVHVGEGVLKTVVREIRVALEDGAENARFIETVRSRGYRFIGAVEVADPLAAAPVDAAAVPAPYPPRYCAVAVGRQAELAFLKGCWAKARRGERQVVFVVGEAGIGKTALVNALIQDHLATEADVTVAWGQCVDQYGAGEPYLPIIEALHRACRSAGGERVAQALRQNAPAWCAHMPGLLASNAALLPEATSAAATPERMLRQMAEAFEALTRERGLVLLIEDLHWADPSTLDLLAYTAQRSDPARLLIIATYRGWEAAAGRLAELATALSTRNKCLCLSVPYLSERAVREYVTSRLQAHVLPDGLTRLLHDRTEGNALFMVSVVDAWLERGLLTIGEGRCSLTAGMDELARCVPESFVRMVQRDVELSSPFERSVLEAASVAGPRFSAATVASALGADALEVEDLCRRWARGGQFFRGLGAAEWKDGTLADRFEFVHVLYREVIYDQLSATRQAHWHRRIGERLEVGHGPDTDLIAAELAVHFQRGREHRRAVRYSRRSGEQSLDRGAYREALDHLTRALESAARLPDGREKAELELELLILLAAPLRMTKGFAAPEVERTYARAAELCSILNAVQQLFPILAGTGAAYVLRSSLGAALELGKRFARMAEEHEDPAALTEARLVLGIAHHGRGEHRDAIIQLARVIASGPLNSQAAPMSLGGRHPAVAAQGFLALSYCMMGQVDRGQAEAKLALSTARELADPFAMALALNFCGHVHYLRRELSLARKHTAELAAVCEQYGLGMFAALGHLQSARAEIEEGALRQGIENLKRASAQLEVLGTRVYHQHVGGLLARGLSLAGQGEEARAVLEAARVGRAGDDERVWAAELLRIRGEVLAGMLDGTAPEEQTRHGAEAEGCLWQALDTAREQGAKLFELRAATSLARYWRVQGNARRAHALLADVYASFDEGLGTADLVEARQLLEELSSNLSPLTCRELG